MIPILFDSENLEYFFLGKGKLADTISCVISETLNGEYTLTLRYPVSGPLLSELYQGGTIGAFGPQFDSFNNGYNLEFFDLYKHDLPIDGVVTFYAQHISRRFARNVFRGNTVKAYFPSVWDYSTPKDIGVPVTSIAGEGDQSKTVSPVEPKSTLAALIGDENSIVSLGYDVAFVSRTYATTPTAHDQPDLAVRVVPSRGQDNGIQIRYGYNLLDLNYTKDAIGTYNALVPFWTDGNGTNHFVSGYVVQPTTPISPIVAVPYDCTQEFSTQPTEAQMTTLARSILDNSEPWNPETTIEVDYFNSEIVNPHGARLALGDYVSVYWGEALIAEKLRVVSYEFDVLTQSYAKLHLGTQQTEFVAVTGEVSAGGGSSGGGESKIVKLWENASPNNSFSSQTVSIPTLSEYDLILILYMGTAGDSAKPTALYKNDIGSGIMTAMYNPPSGYGAALVRAFTIAETGITINNATRKDFNSTSRVTDNTRCVPYQIHGIKL